MGSSMVIPFAPACPSMPGVLHPCDLLAACEVLGGQGHCLACDVVPDLFFHNPLSLLVLLPDSKQLLLLDLV